MKMSMKRTIAVITTLMLVALGLTLGGCGGSGGGISSEVVSGTASVGAPLTGQVMLKDASSPAQSKTAVIGSDGTFAFDVTGLKPPFILQGAGSVNGTDYKLHSFAAGTGIANVNPFSNALVASAAGVAAPEQIFAAPDPAAMKKIETALPAATTELMTQLQPLLKLYGAEGKDPIHDPYQADHKGLDGVFDNVSITIPNGVITVANTSNGAVIFSAPVTDLQNGQFNNNPSSLPEPAAMPATPTGVAAAGGTGQITVSWNAVGNASAYNLYYATTSGVTTTNGTKIANVTAPFTHSGLADGTYYYIVTAVNSAGESAPSAEVSAVSSTTAPLPLPAAPAGVIATGGTKQTTITWNAVPGATSYNLYYATTAGVTKTSGTKLANVTSPAVHSNLSAATTYYYIVTAINAAGEGPASVQVAATTLSPTPVTPPAPVLPSAPVSVSATGGNRQLSVSWAAVSGATSYNLYWSTSNGVTPSNGTKVVGVTGPYVLTGLADATTYYVVVTAVNSAGESVASAQASATTNPPVTKQLTLTWDPVTGATSYNLYWSTTPGVTPATGKKISGVQYPYVHTGLAAATTYYYVVTATDGTSESAPSAQASGTTQP